MAATPVAIRPPTARGRTWHCASTAGASVVARTRCRQRTHQAQRHRRSSVADRRYGRVGRRRQPPQGQLRSPQRGSTAGSDASSRSCRRRQGRVARRQMPSQWPTASSGRRGGGTAPAQRRARRLVPARKRRWWPLVAMAPARTCHAPTAAEPTAAPARSSGVPAPNPAAPMGRVAGRRCPHVCGVRRSPPLLQHSALAHAVWRVDGTGVSGTLAPGDGGTPPRRAPTADGGDLASHASRSSLAPAPNAAAPVEADTTHGACSKGGHLGRNARGPERGTRRMQRPQRPWARMRTSCADGGRPNGSACAVASCYHGFTQCRGPLTGEVASPRPLRGSPRKKTK